MLARWLTRLHPIHLAKTPEEREAIFRFRYSIYSEEYGRDLGAPDHTRKWIRDAEDDKPTTTLLYAGAPDEIQGTVRLRHWLPGAVPEEVMRELSMDLVPGIERRHTAEIGRFMISKARRGKLLLASFSAKVYDLLCAEHNTELTFCYCAPTLISYYRKIGARPFGGRLVETPDEVMVPLMSIMSDHAFYKQVGSPLASLVSRHFGRGKRAPIDPEPYQHLFEAESTPVEADAEKVWAELQDAVIGEDADTPSVLDSLPPETVKQLTRRGFLMDVPAGKIVARKGLKSQEMFVVVEGLFEVTDEGRTLRMLGKGELFGEVAFFVETQKRTATVKSLTDGRVLVLHAQTLREMIKSDPTTAAHVLLALGRLMAQRFAAPIQQRHDATIEQS